LADRAIILWKSEKLKALQLWFSLNYSFPTLLPLALRGEPVPLQREAGGGFKKRAVPG
jgi:hypothetical protein